MIDFRRAGIGTVDANNCDVYITALDVFPFPKSLIISAAKSALPKISSFYCICCYFFFLTPSSSSKMSGRASTPRRLTTIL